MTSTIDPKSIGKVVRPRRHVRTLTGMYFPNDHYTRTSPFRLLIVVATGYLPEKDASGKDKWPRGEEKAWREGMRSIDKGIFMFLAFFLNTEYQHFRKMQMLIRSRNLLLTTYKHLLLVNVIISVRRSL